MRTRRFSCRRVSLLGRPGENRTLRASAPCRRHAFRHRITELAAHLMRRATSFRDNSARRSFSARLRSEEHTSELQSRVDLVCRLLLEKKKKKTKKKKKANYNAEK